MSWLGGFRRLHRRYKRKPEPFLAFTGIAAALLCYRRLRAWDCPINGVSRVVEVSGVLR